MDGVAVCGDITAKEVYDALKQCYPKRVFSLNSLDDESKSTKSDIIITPLKAQFKVVQKQIEEKEKEYTELEETAAKAGLSIQALNKQQLALYDEFVLLRQRYDEQKTSLVNILWSHCAKHHPDLRQIPQMEDEESFCETDTQVGSLNVGEALGEGQFATVKSCTRDNTSKEYALKIIKKDRITTFASLMRVSNEIDNLKLLRSPYVVTVSEVMHTVTKLYIVTEKGGFDLFEFFDEHQDGVPEAWAKEIIVCILKGVLYCHEQGICHRDLKPENILLEFDTKNAKCIDLKLCDFGLSTKFKPKVLLTDFCGSPGFFAPEMIIHGAYYGDKADVWSIGCILLELMMGHEKFCDVWMTAYDYEILQDKEQFTSSIEDTAEELPGLLNFSEDLNEFILKFLELRSTKRPNVKGLCAHPWLAGLLDGELASLRNTKLTEPMGSPTSRSYTPPPLSPSQSFIMDPADAPNRRDNINHNQEAIKVMYNNLSEKERRQMEEYIMHHKQQMQSKSVENNGEEHASNGHGHHHHHQMSLPPIVPQTPNLKAVKKIMRKGNELANGNYNSGGGGGLFDSPVPSSSGGGSHFYSPAPSPQMQQPYSPVNGRNTLPRVNEAADDLDGTGGSLSILTSPERGGSDKERQYAASQSEPKQKSQLLVSFSEKLLQVSNSP